MVGVVREVRSLADIARLKYSVHELKVESKSKSTFLTCQCIGSSSLSHVNLSSVISERVSYRTWQVFIPTRWIPRDRVPHLIYTTLQATTFEDPH